MNEPNWAALWRELTERTSRPGSEGKAEHAKRERTERADHLLDFVLRELRPGDSVLDIGAGGGRFAIPFARAVRSVTAIEPSEHAVGLLRQNAAGIGNIHIVQARWEEAEEAVHDIAFCSHAMYSSPDFAAFVRKMERSARRLCFLVMRVPSHDGVLPELSKLIYGQPHDSPNFWIGYRLLYEMGIYANVLMEPAVRQWTDVDLEGALERARRHLRLTDRSRDGLIRDTLTRRLTFRDGCYWWPDGMRSAIAWWQPIGG